MYLCATPLIILQWFITFSTLFYALLSFSFSLCRSHTHNILPILYLRFRCLFLAFYSSISFSLHLSSCHFALPYFSYPITTVDTLSFIISLSLRPSRTPPRPATLSLELPFFLVFNLHMVVSLCLFSQLLMLLFFFFFLCFCYFILALFPKSISIFTLSSSILFSSLINFSFSLLFFGQGDVPPQLTPTLPPLRITTTTTITARLRCCTVSKAVTTS